MFSRLLLCWSNLNARVSLFFFVFFPLSCRIPCRAKSLPGFLLLSRHVMGTSVSLTLVDGWDSFLGSAEGVVCCAGHVEGVREGVRCDGLVQVSLGVVTKVFQ